MSSGSLTSLFGEEKPQVEGQRCGICGTSEYDPVELYGHPVCKRCARDFANRRALAFLIDYILLLIVYPVWIVSMELGDAYAGLIVLGYVALPIKDGFLGYSPGKVLLGVRAYSAESGSTVGPVLSFVRNMVLYIPFAPLVAAVQLEKGSRIGDGIANTRVIWVKHSSCKVFALPVEGAR